MKKKIAQLKEAIKVAKVRQDEANKEVKRIERDMAEFSNNKGSKLAELQTSLEELKETFSKNSGLLRPLQADMNEAKVELEQCSSDLASSQEQFEEVQATLKAQQEELDKLLEEQAQAKVGQRRLGLCWNYADHNRTPTMLLKQA